MACHFCGGQYCTGGCLNVAHGGLITVCQVCGRVNCIGQCVAAGNAGGGYMHTYGQTTQQNLTAIGVSSIFAMEAYLHTFLEIIADKQDTEAVIAFMERQKVLKIKQDQELERLKKQYQDDLEKAEKEFLEKCQKYRPSITPEVLIRIKDLKAFY